MPECLLEDLKEMWFVVFPALHVLLRGGGVKDVLIRQVKIFVSQSWVSSTSSSGIIQILDVIYTLTLVRT